MLAWITRVWTVLAIAASAAHAQAPQTPGTAPATAGAEAPEPPGYREAVDQAISEYEAGRFAEARALFERAHGLFPNARALRGLGMAEFELRNYPASIYYLEQALASPSRPLSSELRTETEQLLSRARTFVGRVKLAIDPPGAMLVLNGTTIQPGPENALNLIVGDYTLQVSAQGYGTEQRQLRIAGGEEQTVTVQLPKNVEVLSPVAPPAAAPADSDESVLASPWLWAAVGVIVAGAAVGVGFAVAGGESEPVAPSGGSSGFVADGP